MKLDTTATTCVICQGPLSIDIHTVPVCDDCDNSEQAEESYRREEEKD